MYCNSCGKIIENGAVFCTGCGKRLNEAPTQQEIKPAEVTSDGARIPVIPPFNSNVFENEAQSSKNEEKTYFGKGALILCLVVIGILSISTGVLAGLYLSLL